MSWTPQGCEGPSSHWPLPIPPWNKGTGIILIPSLSPSPQSDHSLFCSNSTANPLNQAAIATHLDYSSSPLTSLPDSFLA